MNKKIKKLINISKEVISDCALENGAIIAANTDKPYYPRTGSNWRLVWPRDASYICVAADILGLSIQEPFFDWLIYRPEDFKKESILYQNYSTNGRCVERQFQPDQGGGVLWALYYHFKNDLKKGLKYRELIERIANGLCRYWDKEYFILNAVDLWEEEHRMTSTKIKNNHTYSLAACARGLLCADAIIHRHVWKEVAFQMLKKIDEAYSKNNRYFYRNHGLIDDKNVDASMLALVWPFEIYEAKDKRIINTVKKIEERIVINRSVHRYEFDYYDGEGTAGEGGGAWPLLNFWMSIYWSLRGNKKKAQGYYNWVLERVDKYIPEQLFEDIRKGKGPCPLAWAHAMLVIASKFLGYI